ncbi:MAG: ABC transporter substrate-binding protein [Oscillospiraceae bacterium]|nr:ABC transporter substrate-binding protein [Oscillospiraceae bacterium]
MKKIIAIVMVLCMVVGLCACGSSSSTQSTTAATSGDTVRIGVYEPASGDNGAPGKQETLGIQYANSVSPTVEIGGKTYNVELQIVDNESSNDKAISAAQTLVSAGVSVALGSYGSGVSIAGSDVFANAGIPVIGVSCTNPQVTAGNDHYFRICFLDPFQGTVLANLAVEKYSAKKAYVLTKLGDDYSVGVGNYFKAAFEKLGGTCIVETFQDGNSDFTSYITKAKNEGCDICLSPISVEAAALFLEQAATQNIGMPILAGDTFDSNVIAGAAKGTNLDLYCSTFYVEGGNPEFDTSFKTWMENNSTALANNGGNTTIAACSVLGYDAYFVALEALKAAGSTDPAAVKTALPSVSYDGITGHIEFDETGDAIRDAAFVKHMNTTSGAWELYGEQKVSN